MRSSDWSSDVCSSDLLLMPGDFIPAAERFRLGVQIDRHVVAMVLHWFDSHPDALADVDTCAINLTAGSLVNEDFARFVAAPLRGTSDERRVGKEGVSTCRTRWPRYY